MRISYFVFILLFLTACQTETLVEVCFTPEQDCEAIFVSKIEQSTDIRCALYDLDSNKLKESLDESNILVFEKNWNGFGTKVGSKGLMHNKFCILDKRIVITGSLNPTNNGFNKNNNNMIIIESKKLAKNYLKEWYELQTKIQKTQKKKIKVNGFIIENYFCPEDNCKQQIIKELNKAEKNIHFLTFSFTDKEIANLLIDKSKTLEVEGIMEKQRINMKYNVYKQLNNTSVKIYLDKNPNIMHHKLFIIDEKTVILGSYNPTKAANERNDENILIIHDEKIAKVYLKEFEKIINY